MSDVEKEIKKVVKNFANSKNGKNWIIVGIACFLLGVVWQIVLWTLAIFGVGYLVWKKQESAKKGQKNANGGD